MTERFCTSAFLLTNVAEETARPQRRSEGKKKQLLELKFDPVLTQSLLLCSERLLTDDIHNSEGIKLNLYSSPFQCETLW